MANHKEMPPHQEEHKNKQRHNTVSLMFVWEGTSSGRTAEGTVRLGRPQHALLNLLLPLSNRKPTAPKTLPQQASFC